MVKNYFKKITKHDSHNDQVDLTRNGQEGDREKNVF